MDEEGIEVGGQRFRVGKLNARKQFNVFRRLAPLLATSSTLLDVVAKVQRQGKGETASDEPEIPVDQLLGAFAPLADELAKLDDTTVDYVIDTCLSACQISTPGGWRQLTTANGQLLFQTLEWTTQLRLTWEVVAANLGNFSSALPGS